MPKDLTTSRLDRQNILNNEIAVEEIQGKSGIEGVLFESKIFKKLLCSRFDIINFEQAKEDVRPFIKDTGSLSLWSAYFFKQITDNLK